MSADGAIANALFQWALYGKQYQTVKFLVQQGADADYSDWVEDQNFSKVHKIVCGLSLDSLDEALLADPRSMNYKDALGRPNILDHQLAPPVSYAADRNHADYVRLLLEAGAETDPVLPNGYIGGFVLNCAARNATDPFVLKTLLDFGAKIESAGVDGRTSLIHVARTDNAGFAKLLLGYGADINAISASTQTPLTTAIISNSHNVLRLLLGHCAKYHNDLRLEGPNLLQAAALYGDVETLRILTQADHFRLNYDKRFIGGFAKQLRE
ncbi:ankyrin repeat-containing domain protein [Aspergillus carlsbadensis]|nr:ankyrin repeat-containing domain protein [Aspergillus carlsbadensis]